MIFVRCYLFLPSFSSEKAMAPHSSTLAWKIPWMEEPGGLQSMGSQRVGHDWGLHFHFSLSCTGEGNGNPLQYSCLQNPHGQRGLVGYSPWGHKRVGCNWTQTHTQACICSWVVSSCFNLFLDCRVFGVQQPSFTLSLSLSGQFSRVFLIYLC